MKNILTYSQKIYLPYNTNLLVEQDDLDNYLVFSLFTNRLQTNKYDFDFSSYICIKISKTYPEYRLMHLEKFLEWYK